MQLLLKYNVDIQYICFRLGLTYFVQYANDLIKKIIIQMVYLQDVRIYIYTTVYIYRVCPLCVGLPSPFCETVAVTGGL